MTIGLTFEQIKYLFSEMEKGNATECTISWEEDNSPTEIEFWDKNHYLGEIRF